MQSSEERWEVFQRQQVYFQKAFEESVDEKQKWIYLALDLLDQMNDVVDQTNIDRLIEHKERWMRAWRWLMKEPHEFNSFMKRVNEFEYGSLWSIIRHGPTPKKTLNDLSPDNHLESLEEQTFACEFKLNAFLFLETWKERHSDILELWLGQKENSEKLEENVLFIARRIALASLREGSKVVLDLEQEPLWKLSMSRIEINGKNEKERFPWEVMLSNFVQIEEWDEVAKGRSGWFKKTSEERSSVYDFPSYEPNMERLQDLLRKVSSGVKWRQAQAQCSGYVFSNSPTKEERQAAIQSLESVDWWKWKDIWNNIASQVVRRTIEDERLNEVCNVIQPGIRKCQPKTQIMAFLDMAGRLAKSQKRFPDSPLAQKVMMDWWKEIKSLPITRQEIKDLDWAQAYEWLILRSSITSYLKEHKIGLNRIKAQQTLCLIRKVGTYGLRLSPKKNIGKVMKLWPMWKDFFSVGESKTNLERLDDRKDDDVNFFEVNYHYLNHIKNEPDLLDAYLRWLKTSPGVQEWPWSSWLEKDPSTLGDILVWRSSVLKVWDSEDAKSEAWRKELSENQEIHHSVKLKLDELILKEPNRLIHMGLDLSDVDSQKLNNIMIQRINLWWKDMHGIEKQPEDVPRLGSRFWTWMDQQPNIDKEEVWTQVLKDHQGVMDLDKVWDDWDDKTVAMLERIRMQVAWGEASTQKSPRQRF